MLEAVHRQGYQAPPIRRVYIPKPGKQEKRPLGIPCVSDRALQRSTAEVLFHFHIDDKIITLQQRRSGDGTTSERW